MVFGIFEGFVESLIGHVDGIFLGKILGRESREVHAENDIVAGDLNFVVRTATRKQKEILAVWGELKFVAPLSVLDGIDVLGARFFGICIDFGGHVRRDIPHHGVVGARGEEPGFAVDVEGFDGAEVGGRHGAVICAMDGVVGALADHVVKEGFAGFVEGDFVQHHVVFGVEAAISGQEIEGVIVELDGLKIETGVRVEAL